MFWTSRRNQLKWKLFLHISNRFKMKTEMLDIDVKYNNNNNNNNNNN